MMLPAAISVVPDEIGRVAPAPLLPPEGEFRLFWWLRWRVAAAVVREALRKSRLRIAVFAVFTAVFWVVLFRLFAESFQLAHAHLPHAATRAQTVQAIFNLFFLALTVMMGFSAAIILYGSLFRSDETTYLLTTPISCRRIVLHKFHEATFLTGWGFLLLGSPLLVAYGTVAMAPWYYFALLPPFMVAFVAIPSALGAMGCLVVMYCWPQARRRALYTITLLSALGLALVARHALGGIAYDVMTPAWFQHVLDRLEFAEQRLAPSWWLSTGLLQAAHPSPGAGGGAAWRESLLFLAVLTTNALVLGLAVGEIGERLLRASYSQSQGNGNPSRRRWGAGFDRGVLFAFGWLPLPLRLLVLNDVRLCRRDPLQWSQLAIFLGLFALYFANMRRFQHGEPMQQWITLVGFLNLGVVCLILSAFTTRFIFPLISLEGRRFWVLGTLPITRDAILWGKLVFACSACWLPCAVLIFLSDVRLQIVERTPWVAVIHQVACLQLCLALAALAVGLGARYPERQSQSPSQIASGFGGTLTLVMSAAVVLTVLMLLGIPCYYWVEAQTANGLAIAPQAVPRYLPWLGLGTPRAVWFGLAAALAISGAATVFPLAAGFRAFRSLEW